MKSRVTQMVFYTRPWEVAFHVALARALGSTYPGVPVRFVTFFHWARNYAQAAGFPVVYMPEALKTVTGAELAPEEIRRIDRQLYEGVGANLNLMLHSERFLPKAARAAELFGRKHLVVLDRLIQPGTLSVSSMYDHYCYWLAGSLANIRAGWHFAFTGCGLPAGRSVALRTPWEVWPGTMSLAEAADLRAASLRAFAKPVGRRIEYMRPPIVPPLLKRLKARWWEIRCSQYDAKAGSYFPSLEPLIRNRLKLLWPRSVWQGWDLRTEQDLPRVTAPFVFIPLHMEPEATILMFSPWLRDQVELCRLVAQALPSGWGVLVKENPKMTGVRAPAFYRQLKSLPGLRLVHPDVPSMALIQQSQITITLAGTASNEAALLGKPSLCLGCPPFRHLTSLSRTCPPAPMNELFQQLQSLASGGVDEQAWHAWVRGTFSGSLVPRFGENLRWELPHDDAIVASASRFIECVAVSSRPETAPWEDRLESTPS